MMQSTSAGERNNVLEQFILKDPSIVRSMIAAAEVNAADHVLEIGAGTGEITRRLARYAHTVTALEIDLSFRSQLSKMPSNVQVLYEDVHDFMRTPYGFNKIVANIPFGIGEWLFHFLTPISFDVMVLCVSEGFLTTLSENGFYDVYYAIEKIRPVPVTSFRPTPQSPSVIIRVTHHPDPLLEKNGKRYLQQYCISHRDQKIKNAFMEGIITYSKEVKNIVVTKNQARTIIQNAGIPQEILAKRSKEIPTVYQYAEAVVSVIQSQEKNLF